MKKTKKNLYFINEELEAKALLDEYMINSLKIIN